MLVIKYVFVCCRFDEVVVGAPMYSTLDARRNDMSIERGRVFVYWNVGVCTYILHIHSL